MSTEQETVTRNGAPNGEYINACGGLKSVVIVGAGPVGMFLAFRLGKAGIKVTVIEKESATSEAPRACGYYGASAVALLQAGLYQKIEEQGFVIRGLCWRKRPVDDGNGGKRLGDVIATQPLADPEQELSPPAGLLCLQQSLLTKLLVLEALATGNVAIEFDRELVKVEDNDESVTAVAKDVPTGVLHRITASFLVGADGGRSVTRKLLEIPFVGHTWPERLLATDVELTNGDEIPTYSCHYVMDRINYTVVVPLTKPVPHQKSLWRYTMALHPDDDRPDEDVLKDAHIMGLYEGAMAGPRPLQVAIKRRATYRIHQRLAVTLRRGRSLLVGDAAHVCNPYGAMGLNTGILDADALAETIIMILMEKKPLSLLDVYSDERRKVFQFFVDPTTTQNKLRVHNNEQEVAARDDWYFRMMANPTKEALMELSTPYFETWRTDMRKLSKVR